MHGMDRITKGSIVVSCVLSSLLSLVFGINLTMIDCAREAFTTTNAAGVEIGGAHVAGTWASVKAIFCIGALAGTLLSTHIRLRRKSCLIVCSLFYVIGVALMLLSQKYWVFFASRVLVGVAMGLTSAYVPIYLNSVTPPEKRGVVSSLHQLFVVIGILLGQMLSFFFSTLQNWKMGVYPMLVFSAFHTVALFLISDVSVVARKPKSILCLFENKQAKLSITTIVVLNLAQQSSCINGVLAYTGDIIEDGKSSSLYTVMLGLTFVSSTIGSMVFVDRFGRKPLLLTSMAIDIASLVMLGTQGSEMRFISLLIFVLGFSFGLGPVVSFIGGEIFPDEYKAPGMSVSACTGWPLTYITLMYFPEVLRRYEETCFLYFAASLFACFLYILLFFKETKGKHPDFQKLK